MALFNILVDIAARTANLESGMDRVDTRLKKFGDNVQRVFNVVAASVVVQFTKNVIDAGSAMQSAAERAAVNGKAFSELAYAGKIAGVSVDGLSKAFIQMNKALSEARTGGKLQNDALAALGLTLKDLRDLKPEDQFTLLADRISRLADEGDKARAEITFFGKAGAEMGELFNKGAKGIAAARLEAQRVGQSFTAEQLKNLDDAHKSIDRLESSFGHLATTLVAKASPALSSFFDTLTAQLSGDKILKLRSQIESLQATLDLVSKYKQEPEFAIERRRQELTRLREELRLAEGGQPARFLASGGSTATSEGAGSPLPGFLADITPFTPTQQRRFGNPRGINPVLEQFDEETKSTLDGIYQQYRETKNKIQNLLDEGVITPEEFAQRMEAAWAKFQNADYISPVFISARKVINAQLTIAQQNVRAFTDDFKSSMADAFNQGGSVAKNFARALISALENRLIFNAISKIGDALAASLDKGASSGGFLGQLLGLFYNSYGSGEISPVTITQSKVPTYALGTDYVPRTGLAMLHQGEAVLTREENAGGGGYGGLVLAPVYNIDARGATMDLAAALPEILRRNNEQLKNDIIVGMQRGKYPVRR